MSETTKMMIEDVMVRLMVYFEFHGTDGLFDCVEELLNEKLAARDAVIEQKERSIRAWKVWAKWGRSEHKRLYDLFVQTVKDSSITLLIMRKMESRIYELEAALRAADTKE